MCIRDSYHRIPTKKGNAGLIEGRENEDEKEYILLPPSTEGLIEAVSYTHLKPSKKACIYFADVRKSATFASAFGNEGGDVLTF